MKRILSVMLLMSFCLTLLSGCDSNGNEESNLSQSTYGYEFIYNIEAFEYQEIDFGGKDYLFEYDGARITKIYINPEAEAGITLEIPAICENGEPLEEIAPDAFIKVGPMPFLTVEALEDIVERINKESFNHRDANTFEMFYCSYDIDDERYAEEKRRERMLKSHPLAEYCKYAILEPAIIENEYKALKRILQYADINATYLENMANEMLDSIPEDAPWRHKYTELILPSLYNIKLGAYEKVKTIVFPEVEHKLVINYGFSCFTGLERAYGSLKNYYINEEDSVQFPITEEYLYERAREIYVHEWRRFGNLLYESNRKGFLLADSGNYISEDSQ